MDRNKARSRAEALVAQMTLEEKASQLKYDAPAIDRLGVPAYNWWNEALHGVARAGTATVFPQAIGLAAIFDEAFHRRVAEVIATEGRAKYNAQSALGDRDIYKGLTFWSPNINIFRDPRWGRGQETYGEDPYLTTRLGVAFVEGLQGDGEYMKAAACAKHYAVHSGPEDLRHEFDAQPSHFDLWDTYLPAFEALVKEAGVEAVMGAYNRVDGEPACGSQTLIADILRGQWGFDGHFVSDCWAIADFHLHHKVTDTPEQSAAMAIKAGCDVNCGNTYLYILKACQEGLIAEEDIDRACVRLMTCRYLLGLFDTDCAYNAISPDLFDTDDHDSLALEAARKSIVLLKNDSILPLDLRAVDSIAVIGPNADSIVALEGNYAGTSSRYVTFLEGIRTACRGKTRVNYSLGCHLYKDRTSGLAAADDRMAEAISCVERSDVTILCLGLDSTIEGEQGDAGNEYSSGDKPDLYLPKSQKKLLEAVKRTGKPFIVVISSGSALAVEDGNAVLWTGYPGQAGGTALKDILFGRICPSGKLPVTFYRTTDDLPEFTDYAMANRTYRYYRGEPLYPFGFGLSYTQFEYEDAEYDAESALFSATVKNVGPRPGEEVVQVYVKPLDDEAHGLNHKLCAFGRVFLNPGEAVRVRLRIRPSAFELVNDEGDRYTPEGAFRLTVGGSQPDPVSVKLMGREPLSITVNRP